MKSRKEILERIAFAGIAIMFAFWLAYVWELSTGLTWATRNRTGQISTADHLKRTRNAAIGATCIFLPLAAIAFVNRDR